MSYFFEAKIIYQPESLGDILEKIDFSSGGDAVKLYTITDVNDTSILERIAAEDDKLENKQDYTLNTMLEGDKINLITFNKDGRVYCYIVSNEEQINAYQRAIDKRIETFKEGDKDVFAKADELESKISFKNLVLLYRWRQKNKTIEQIHEENIPLLNEIAVLKAQQLAVKEITTWLNSLQQTRIAIRALYEDYPVVHFTANVEAGDFLDLSNFVSFTETKEKTLQIEYKNDIDIQPLNNSFMALRYNGQIINTEKTPKLACTEDNLFRFSVEVEYIAPENYEERGVKIVRQGIVFIHEDYQVQVPAFRILNHTKKQTTEVKVCITYKDLSEYFVTEFENIHYRKTKQDHYYVRIRDRCGSGRTLNTSDVTLNPKSNGLIGYFGEPDRYGYGITAAAGTLSFAGEMLQIKENERYTGLFTPNQFQKYEIRAHIIANALGYIYPYAASIMPSDLGRADTVKRLKFENKNGATTFFAYYQE